MTKPFDPTKPFTTKSGKQRTFIGVLSGPTPIGETIVVQDPDDGSVDLYFPDGRYNKDRPSPSLDLVNTPDHVEVEAWAVVNKNGCCSAWAKKEDAENAASSLEGGGRVVWLTGSYER